ncbi:hypothetical protein [Meiothermus sp. Pnk-1]|uniref:hypothetical protein n=1 Tax=Meiothermus sp. Pnk-1 TaxID=873128 RepID=UPI000D7C0283|nr:hypothetical protein [Meiothermus sp. Pnk-1]PZA08314.1 hypothetical protein DNA98_04035 [Meiothermus sp. Pnk-1]
MTNENFHISLSDAGTVVSEGLRGCHADFVLIDYHPDGDDISPHDILVAVNPRTGEALFWRVEEGLPDAGYDAHGNTVRINWRVWEIAGIARALNALHP